MVVGFLLLLLGGGCPADCLNGLTGEPVRRIMSGEPEGDKPGLALGLVFVEKGIPAMKCISL